MGVSVEAAGVDTWSPSWYVAEGHPAGRALDALATQPSARGKLCPDRVAGHRLGWIPSARLAYAEGHPAAALGSDGLACPDRLPEALYRVWEACTDYGVLLPEGLPHSVLDRPLCDGGPLSATTSGFAGVRRVDATVDLRFDSAVEGLAFMQGVAAIGMTRAKQAVWRDVGGWHHNAPDPAQAEAWRHGNHELDGGPRARAMGARPIETVAFYGHAGKKMLARVYDKGVESGTAPRGLLIRPEDQRRFVKGTRRGVDELTSMYVREKFRQRFRPLWQASKGVIVSGPAEIARAVRQRVDAGDCSPRMAEAIVGFAICEQAGVWEGSRSTYFRRRAQLRELGIVPSELGLDDVEVDLADVLAEAFESDAWQREG